MIRRSNSYSFPLVNQLLEDFGTFDILVWDVGDINATAQCWAMQGRSRDLGTNILTFDGERV